MKWRRNEEISNEQIIQMARQLKANELLIRILVNRGLTYDEIRVLLNDIHEAIIEPSQLTNAEEAAKIIAEYCRNKSAEIWVFADYDADGITSGYIMTSALREVARCTVDVHYPERKDGYGLSMEWCEAIVNRKDCGKQHPILVITVDNGIAQAREIAFLRENGIEVIVTDHHTPNGKTPECLIVDPHYNNDERFKHLAGCGVAFKVAQLVQREFNVYNMMKYTYAVAIGTVADVMPLTLENMAYIQFGLSIMNSKDCPTGIKEFKDYIGKAKLTSTDIGWELAPRINACGRMGDVNLASKLFFTEELEYDSEIEDVINAMERCNLERKSYSDKAKKMLKDVDADDGSICILDVSGFPEGIVGIIANDVLHKFKKPAIIVAGDGENLKGSARSIEGISLQEIFKDEMSKGNIVEFGGHDVAAGITISRDKLDTLKQNLNQTIEQIRSTLPEIDEVESELLVDEVIDLNNINESTYDIINVVPFDNRTFPAPVFALIDVEVIGTKLSGKNPDNICFTLKDGTGKIEVWAWGFANKYKEIGSPKHIHIAGNIERNFMNKKFFTLKVIDILSA